MRRGVVRSTWILSIAVLLGFVIWVVWRWVDTRLEDAIVRRLREQGADVAQRDGTVWGIAFRDRKTEVVFDGAKLTEETLSLLAGLRQLDAIAFARLTLPKDFALPAPRMRSLRELCMSRVRAGDQFWARLPRLENLACVELSNLTLDDLAIEHIASVKSLRVLNIDGCGVNDNGLAHLSGHQDLWKLGVRRCPITDEGLRNRSHLGE